MFQRRLVKLAGRKKLFDNVKLDLRYERDNPHCKLLKSTDVLPGNKSSHKYVVNLIEDN